jgi:DNA processing protein
VNAQTVREPRGLEGRELAARIGLLAAPGLPQWRALELLQQHGSGLAAYDALASECGRDLAAAARSDAVRRRVKRALRAIRETGMFVIGHDDPVYPEQLLQRLGRAAPPLLFGVGSLDLLDVPAVAVVGCRRATEYGLDMAEQIGSGVARAGACVVSGLARGIDAAAHTAALDAGGPSIAVLGCGVDVYYPRENVALQDRMADDALVLSEQLPGEPPRKHQFPHRNRIIAGLSRIVVVVEAGERSGALTTGSHAADQGLDVVCVTNAVHMPNMQGILALLREGAHAYTGVHDLLLRAQLLRLGEPVPVGPGTEEAASADDPAPAALDGRVWAMLKAQPIQVDTLSSLTGLPVRQLLAVLLELELDGCVRQLPGLWFVRVSKRRRRAA